MRTRKQGFVLEPFVFEIEKKVNAQIKKEVGQKIEEAEPGLENFTVSAYQRIKGRNIRTYLCDICGRSWSNRRSAVNHRLKGKCEPRWVRWSKLGVQCVHPDCQWKPESECVKSHSELFKHIMECHATAKTSVRNEFLKEIFEWILI